MSMEAAEEARAEALERRRGILAIEADDGRYAVVLRNVAYVKRFLRESRVGFGTPEAP